MLLSKKSCGLMVIEVNLGNPNGDPDNLSAPRVLSNGCGLITDVSMKRKFRDLFSDHDTPVFKELSKNMKLVGDEFHIFESAFKGFEGVSLIEAKKAAFALYQESPQAFYKKYFDVRVFGTTALDGDKTEEEEGDGKAKGKKGKKKETSVINTGVVTITPAVSICPINIAESTITKKHPLRAALLAEGNGDIAPAGKKMVEHGIYVAKIGVNPNIAKHTSTHERDIEVFKNCLKYIFDFSTSASRPVSSIVIRNIFWAEHANALGSFKESEFFAKFMPVANVENPTSANDYTFASLEGNNFNAVDLAH